MKIIKYRNLAENPRLIPFLKKNHYLKDSIPRGSKCVYTFVSDRGKILGMAVFGEPVGKNCKMKYGQDIIELRRFCLVPELNGQNYGSQFLAACLREITKEYSVLTYSDPSKGHNGGIYRASNFIHLGKQKQGSTRKITAAGTPIFAQSHRAKQEKLKFVYLEKKDIWYYPSKSKTSIWR